MHVLDAERLPMLVDIGIALRSYYRRYGIRPAIPYHHTIGAHTKLLATTRPANVSSAQRDGASVWLVEGKASVEYALCQAD